MGNPSDPTSIAGKLGNAVGGGYPAIAARAVANNVINQGVGNLTGSQKGFSWSSVAISGIAAAGGAALTDNLGLTTTSSAGVTSAIGTKLGSDLGIAAANAGVNALTQLTVRGGKVNWQQVATDTITNLIQNRGSRAPASSNASPGIDFTDISGPGISLTDGYKLRVSSQWDRGIADAAAALPEADYKFSRQFYSQQLQFELAAQEEQSALYFGAPLLATGGGASGIIRNGPTMVVNRGWDAALNIASDPFGLIEPMQGTMSALNQLSEAEARSQIKDLRAQLDKLGVNNLPGDVQGWNGNGDLVTDYKATGKSLANAYEGFVRDARLRATWGDNYQNIRIGKSGYTPQQFEEVSLNLQQDTMNKAVVEGMDKLASGKLSLQKGSVMLTLGNYADKQIRDTLREFYSAEGLSESSTYRYVGVNRKISNGLLTGIPDLRLGGNLHSDSTLAFKNSQTEQLRRWVTINAEAYNIMIRPTIKFVPNYNPGSYVIAPRDITPVNQSFNSSRAGRF